MKPLVYDKSACVTLALLSLAACHSASDDSSQNIGALNNYELGPGHANAVAIKAKGQLVVSFDLKYATGVVLGQDSQYMLTSAHVSDGMFDGLSGVSSICLTFNRTKQEEHCFGVNEIEHVELGVPDGWPGRPYDLDVSVWKLPKKIREYRVPGIEPVNLAKWDSSLPLWLSWDGSMAKGEEVRSKEELDATATTHIPLTKSNAKVMVFYNSSDFGQINQFSPATLSDYPNFVRTPIITGSWGLDDNQVDRTCLGQHGDSGGPLYIDKDDKLYLYGLFTYRMAFPLSALEKYTGPREHIGADQVSDFQTYLKNANNKELNAYLEQRLSDAMLQYASNPAALEKEVVCVNIFTRVDANSESPWKKTGNWISAEVKDIDLVKQDQ